MDGLLGPAQFAAIAENSGKHSRTRQPWFLTRSRFLGRQVLKRFQYSFAGNTRAFASICLFIIQSGVALCVTSSSKSISASARKQSEICLPWIESSRYPNASPAPLDGLDSFSKLPLSPLMCRKKTCIPAISVALLFGGSCLLSAKPNVIVVFTDDLGYADLGCQAQEPDVQTPHLDRFAREGIRFTAGYVTAPQCSPSRAGLLMGRIGIDTIPDVPLPLEAVTIAEMMKPVGYVTGQVGKWHLEPNALCLNWVKKHRPSLKPNEQGRIAIPQKDRIAHFPGRQGFDEFFTGEMNRYYANFSLDGENLKADFLKTKGFRIDTQTDAALSFIRRNQGQSFFLYLAYFAPHTPLELAKPYVDRFPKNMPVRRRAALSMIAGIDEGMGRIQSLLKELGLDENTLVVFTSDNGAPLKKHKDTPISGDPGGWNGSMNTPWVGEKGMLSEGGIRVPFLVRWPGTIPGGRLIDTPVSTLDIAPTALAAAGAKAPGNLDGTNLLPLLKNPSATPAARTLYWRFWTQIACRQDKWKYLRLDDSKEFLFDLSSDAHETKDLAGEHPEIVDKLRKASVSWADELQPAGLPSGKVNPQETGWYREYFSVDVR
jgi:arylsulfatase A-like enzyme